ncbi:hypothetical protein A5643_15075 [Mycobacterium sp. 1274756.6]|nr:hypothetical protein A5643_15075 [Mycobacterium sp. 1274756.6]
MLAIALSVCACGGRELEIENPGYPGADDRSVIDIELADHSEADIGFADDIERLHSYEMELLTLVFDRSANSDLLSFVVEAAESRRIEAATLAALRVQWVDGSDVDDRTTAGGGFGREVRGDTERAIADLRTLRGADFDVLWLETMIELDRQVLDLAETHVIRGGNDDAVAAAAGMVASRKSSLGRLNALLRG